MIKDQGNRFFHDFLSIFDRNDLRNVSSKVLVDFFLNFILYLFIFYFFIFLDFYTWRDLIL